MRKLFVVMYHYVRDLKHSRYPEIKGLDITQFKQQIRFLKENFRIITMEDVIEAELTGAKIPEGGVLLTFDDGYIDHYTNVFPILKAEGIQGSFFIPGKTFTEHKLLDVNKIHFILACADIKKLAADLLQWMDYYRGAEFAYPSNQELYQEYAQANRFDDADTIFVKRMLQTVLPEKLRNELASKAFLQYVGISEEKFAHELYLTPEQIRCMKDSGMHIGLHGYDHYWLGNLEENLMRHDVDRAKDALAPYLDKEWVLNYPYGNYSEQVISYAKEKGCTLGMSTEVRAADLDTDNRYTLPRLDTNDFPPKSENYLRGCGNAGV